MNLEPVRTRIFEEGEDLAGFIIAHVPALRDGSVLVVTSKIVALAEGRVAVAKNAREKEQIIRAESEWAIKTKYVWLTEKDGMILANAGIDDSNARGKLVLLPHDSFTNARKLRLWLMRRYHIKKLGVVIADSRVVPMRAGVVGVALGYAGFRGLRDYRGKKDIFGRKLRFTQTNVADSLATAAVLMMGEGKERQPLAVITDAPVEFTDHISRKELLIPFEDDMYRPLFKTPKRRRK